MNRLLALLSAGMMASCYYDTPGNYTLPVTEGASGAVREDPNARPTVRFPARVAVARIEGGHGSFRMIPEADIERDAHAAAAAGLPGVAGLVSLNRVALVSEVKSYRALDLEARKVGADLVAVYRFESGRRVDDAFVPLTVATLGLAPNHSYRALATVTLMVRDARTGYIYGVLEETGESGGLTAGMDVNSAANRAERKARERALDALAEQLPGFWSGVLARGR